MHASHRALRTNYIINSRPHMISAFDNRRRESHTLGARGYFFREIEREIRGGAVSVRREVLRRKKITSGHMYPEPHFRASNWDRICPSSLIGCAKETIPVIG